MLNVLLESEKESLLKQGAVFQRNIDDFVRDNSVLSSLDSMKNINILRLGVYDNDVFIALNENYNVKKYTLLRNQWIKNLRDINRTLDKMPFLLLQLLSSKSDKSYIVGGANRDAIADKTVKDVDFVTDLSVNDIKEILKDEFTFDDVGEHFQVVLAKSKSYGHCFEIAQFRKDKDHNGQGATNVEIGTFEDDWKRRDFTINALYANPLNGEFLDPSGMGINDAQERTLRFIGKAQERIEEDSIRLLRCLKFHQRGYKMSSATLRSFRTHFPLLLKAHPERIREHIEMLVGL